MERRNALKLFGSAALLALAPVSVFGDEFSTYVNIIGTVDGKEEGIERIFVRRSDFEEFKEKFAMYADHVRDENVQVEYRFGKEASASEYSDIFKKHRS